MCQQQQVERGSHSTATTIPHNIHLHNIFTQCRPVRDYCNFRQALYKAPWWWIPWSEICWNNFKYFIIILIVSTNYIFVHLLDKEVFQSSLKHGTNLKIHLIIHLCQRELSNCWNTVPVPELSDGSMLLWYILVSGVWLLFCVENEDKNMWIMFIALLIIEAFD